MSNADDYRLYAEQYFKLADIHGLSVLERGLLLELALTWRQFAEDAEEADEPVSKLRVRQASARG